MTPQGRWLRANGIEQHFHLWPGAGPDLLLIPGITSPALSWAFVARRLAAFSCVRVLDVRGRGLTERWPGMPYDLESCARDVVELARGLGLQRPVLVGHSMGARIGVVAAALAPELFSRLVAVDPPVSGPGRRPYPAALSSYLDPRKALLAGAGIECLRPRHPGWSDADLELRAEWLPTCAEEAIVGSYRSFHEEDLHARLPQVGCPTLLLYAERGGVIAEADAAEFCGLLPDGRARLVRDAGHMIPWDQLDVFVSEVRGFLA